MLMINSYKISLAAGVLAACIFLASCGGGGGSSNGGNTTASPGAAGLTSCGANNALFSVSPIALNQVRGWEPLGHMGPPGHTFPTDHQYLYIINPASTSTTPTPPPVTIPVLAPGDLRVTELRRSTYGASGLTDYTIYFQPCAEVAGWFGHVSTLTGPLASLTGNINQRCNTYQPTPGITVTQCQSDPLMVDIKAGIQIGTVGGGGSLALDWALQDKRITPLHFAAPARFLNGSNGFDTLHTVPASDYFTASLFPQIQARIGRFTGIDLRTIAPIGGTVAMDVDNTARGYWFNPSQPYPPESSHAALATDYITPDKLQVFSVGVSQTNIGSFYKTFTPQTTGPVNRAFESITPSAQIYCYDTNSSPNYILLQLLDAATLKVEGRNDAPNCNTALPYGFTGNGVTYKR